MPKPTEGLSPDALDFKSTERPLSETHSIGGITHRLNPELSLQQGTGAVTEASKRTHLEFAGEVDIQEVITAAREQVRLLADRRIVVKVDSEELAVRIGDAIDRTDLWTHVSVIAKKIIKPI